MVPSIRRFNYLKKVMDSYLKESADLGFNENSNFSKPMSKEKQYFNCGYGTALKDVLDNFHLVEKANLKELEKDIFEIINKIKSDYPTSIVSMDTVSNFVPDFMAHLSIDVYNMPKEKVMEINDLFDELSFDFFKKTNLTILILYHNEEETKRCYPEIISGK